MTFGDTAAGVWLGEVYNNCLRETGTNNAQIDMNLLMHMCRNEPKNAQVAMQILAQELRAELKGRPISEASGIGKTWRLLLGCICMGYSVSQGAIDSFPPELETIMKYHPEIIQCMEFVAHENAGRMDELERDLDSPRKPWWKLW
jgi:hypothetical protein